MLTQGGELVPVLATVAGTEERRVFGANYTYLVTSILSTPSNFCLTYPANCSGAGLGFPDRPSAMKTGTSEPYENSRAVGETWTFGYTPDLVAGTIAVE